MAIFLRLGIVHNAVQPTSRTITDIFIDGPVEHDALLIRGRLAVVLSLRRKPFGYVRGKKTTIIRVGTIETRTIGTRFVKVNDVVETVR